MNILIIEDDASRKASFRRVISTFDSFTLCMAHQYEDVRVLYKSLNFDLILLDHDLGVEIHDLKPVDGLYIVKNIICTKDLPAKYIIVHSHNSWGSQEMMDTLIDQYGDKIELHRAPFGQRCLELLVHLLKKLEVE